MLIDRFLSSATVRYCPLHLSFFTLSHGPGQNLAGRVGPGWVKAPCKESRDMGAAQPYTRTALSRRLTNAKVTNHCYGRYPGGGATRVMSRRGVHNKAAMARCPFPTSHTQGTKKNATDRRPDHVPAVIMPSRFVIVFY